MSLVVCGGHTANIYSYSRIGLMMALYASLLASQEHPNVARVSRIAQGSGCLGSNVHQDDKQGYSSKQMFGK